MKDQNLDSLEMSYFRAFLRAKRKMIAQVHREGKKVYGKMRLRACKFNFYFSALPRPVVVIIFHLHGLSQKKK